MSSSRSQTQRMYRPSELRAQVEAEDEPEGWSAAIGVSTVLAVSAVGAVLALASVALVGLIVFATLPQPALDGPPPGPLLAELIAANTVDPVPHAAVLDEEIGLVILERREPPGPRPARSTGRARRPSAAASRAAAPSPAPPPDPIEAPPTVAATAPAPRALVRQIVDLDTPDPAPVVAETTRRGRRGER